MIWFENKVTGQQWAVTHAGLIERLSNDPDYRVIDDPTKPKSIKSTKSKAGAASAE